MKWIFISLSIMTISCSVAERPDEKPPLVYPKIFVDKIFSLNLTTHSEDQTLTLKSNPLKTDQTFLRKQIIKWGAKAMRDQLFEPDLSFLDEAQPLRTISDIPRKDLLKFFHENKIDEINSIDLKISFTLSFENLNEIKEISNLILGIYFFNPETSDLLELSTFPLLDPEFKKPIFKIYSNDLHPSTTFNYFLEINDAESILENLKRGGSFLLGIKDFEFKISDSYKWSEYRENLKKDNYFFYTILPSQIDLKVENLKESPHQILLSNYQGAIFDRAGNLEAMEGLYNSLNHTEYAPSNNNESLKKGLFQTFGAANLDHLPEPGTSIVLLYSSLGEQQETLRSYQEEQTFTLTDSFAFKNLYLGDKITLEISGTRSTPQVMPPSSKKVFYWALFSGEESTSRVSCEITERVMGAPLVETIKFPEAKNLVIQIGDKELHLKEFLNENPEYFITKDKTKLILEQKLNYSPKLSLFVKNQEVVYLEFGFLNFGNCPTKTRFFEFDTYEPIAQETTQPIIETYQIKYQKFGVKQ
jgi:hypothetical protein